MTTLYVVVLAVTLVAWMLTRKTFNSKASVFEIAVTWFLLLGYVAVVIGTGYLEEKYISSQWAAWILLFFLGLSSFSSSLSFVKIGIYTKEIVYQRSRGFWLILMMVAMSALIRIFE